MHAPWWKPLLAIKKQQPAVLDGRRLADDARDVGFSTIRAHAVDT
jgi:hypothetical protein